ncbi:MULTISPECIES: hypothetical protein [unclassified Amycolatopsis]|uniref:hypothetical protein n=1 Tax=unclassified Amycolatopsis TaxID=2618356 RepID=UPI002874597E|nr:MULTISPECIES: hypothetical protein [unclassified Amycolatopsis]MDS0137523.1 hypothetical protein [Amycolatopsis sp. 505]MDS0141718.1 hypothetical protein [Amycolatopsis sp. CM201R]
MRIHTKRILQVALVSGGLLLVGAGTAAAAGVDLPQPAQAVDAVLPAAHALPAPTVRYTVPASLVQHVPSAEVDGDLQEPDLNAPLGSELTATDLPTLPLTATSGRAIGDGLPLLGGLLPNVQGLLPAMPDLTQQGPGALLGSATSLLHQ